MPSFTPPAPAAPADPKDLLAAVVRTAVPYIVSYVAAVLVKHGFEFNQDQINAAVVPVGGSVYYFFVRILEQYFPKAGWLLGVAKTPVDPARSV